MLKAEFPTAQAVIAGQGQTVRVSGVRIGDIGDVELKDGTRDRRDGHRPEVQGHDPHRRDRAAAAQDRAEGHVHRARAGHRRARRWPRRTARSRSRRRRPTSTPTRSSPSWTPTRATTCKLLIGDAGRGPRRPRRRTCARSSRRFEPTHRDLARVNSAVADAAREPAPPDHVAEPAQRRARQRRRRPRRPRRLLGRRDARVRLRGRRTSPPPSASCPARCSRRPTRSARSQRFADAARPDGRAPAPGRARARRRPTRRSGRSPSEATPLLRDDIRPFVREARPLVRDLRPAPRRLADATPGLTRTFAALNHFFNLLAYNPNGREGPENAARQEGYLFWLAWAAAHGDRSCSPPPTPTARSGPVTIAAPCATVEQLDRGQPRARVPLECSTPIAHRLGGRAAS